MRFVLNFVQLASAIALMLMVAFGYSDEPLKDLLMAIAVTVMMIAVNKL